MSQRSASAATSSMSLAPRPATSIGRPPGRAITGRIRTPSRAKKRPLAVTVSPAQSARKTGTSSVSQARRSAAGGNGSPKRASFG
jgi:hypothetical protein